MSQVTARVSRILYVPWWRTFTHFPSKRRSQNKITTRIATADPSVVLRLIDCWDCGFESLQGHTCLLYCVVTYMSLWWADRSSRGFLPKCGVSESDRETWTVRDPIPVRTEQPRPTLSTSRLLYKWYWVNSGGKTVEAWPTPPIPMYRSSTSAPTLCLHDGL